MNIQEEAFYIWEKNQHLSAEECWKLAEDKIKKPGINNRRDMFYQMKKERHEKRKVYFNNIPEKESSEFINLLDRLIQRVKLIYDNLFNKS